VTELKRLGMQAQEVALDGGFQTELTNTALGDLAPKTVFLSLAARNPAPNAPNAGYGATEPARKTDQPPQTPLRDGPIPPQGRRRPAHLD